MKKWSIDVGNNFVVDASGVGRLFGAGPSIPLVTNYGSHKITERFKCHDVLPARAIGYAGEIRRRRHQRWKRCSHRTSEAGAKPT